MRRANIARCSEPATEFAAVVVDDPTIARDRCRECGSRLVHDLDDAIAAVGYTLRDQSAHGHAVARDALADVFRVAPLAPGQTADQLINAKTLFDAGDDRGALDVLNRWRAALVAAGLID